ncbi:unnamed protein product [Nippostrongylus brasiliensis]|uniref:Uncharacterized protein n=1 Tax=Nippostrongylus brasiliensis TaxID=27835 RepID=A0A0N4Y7Z5_NIPBR|nr:unnamed protein product [Nippostrongylus brasiliensis]
MDVDAHGSEPPQRFTFLPNDDNERASVYSQGIRYLFIVAHFLVTPHDRLQLQCVKLVAVDTMHPIG